jgi:hypothetical protein
MNVAPMNVHGWKFELANSKLLITSEPDAHTHLELSAQAAYSLLDYLYQYRDDLYEETRREASEEVEQRKAESRTPEARDELLSE